LKIGILTFHNTTNYGALFQVFALNRVISEMGFFSEVIDYECDAITAREQLFSIKDSRDGKSFIKALINGNSTKKKFNAFQAFTKQNIPISLIKYTKANIVDANDVYDKFIVGSDQIWNVNLTENDFTYFLDFVKENQKKNSYAASFGYIKLPQSFKAVCNDMLKDFSHISVRETQGQIIIRDLLNTEVPLVLDPTLLLRAEDLVTMGKLETTISDYVLLYFVQDRKRTIQYARQLAKKMGCKVVYINTSPMMEWGVINIRDASPQEFLGWITNARLIITGSFHGVALSVNLQKQFVYELNNKQINYNSRIISLVSLFGLENQTISYSNDDIPCVDYQKVNERLIGLRQKSLTILRTMINE